MHNQNFYHLAAIQSVSLGLPAFITGKFLAHSLGTGVAICSIFIGNVVLWLVGLAVISMVYRERTNAIQNINGYIGRGGGLLFALILTSSFLGWYTLQISSAIIGLEGIFTHSILWQDAAGIRIGAGLGILSAMLAIGDIEFLKRSTAIIFPWIVLYSLYLIWTSEVSITWQWGISFMGIASSIFVLLPGVINLPTFFRHSKSRADSYLGLSIMTGAITFFECTSIWAPFSPQGEFLSQYPISNIFVFVTVMFLVVTLTCSNLLNIYFASACYETFIPRFRGPKGHAIMGLLGTSMFVFVQTSPPLEFIKNLFTDYIVLIVIVLVIAMLLRIVIQHRPRAFEKRVNMASWLVGCAVTTFVEVHHPDQTIQALLHGMGATILFFLLVFFIEETFWAIKKVRQTAGDS